MATSDYIPADDDGLRTFAQNFSVQLTGYEGYFGVQAGDGAPLAALVTAFSNAINTKNATDIVAREQTNAKAAAKNNLVSALRSWSQRLQVHPDITDVERSGFGIKIRDTTPTAVAAPTSQPVLFVGTQNRLQHVVSFKDSLTPLSNAKPSGVHGCEIYRKVGGTVPASISECEFVALDTATPYTVEYSSGDGGVMVHYIGRWATRSGLTGPISDVISKTVVA